MTETEKLLKFIQTYYQQNWSDDDVDMIEKHWNETKHGCENCIDKNTPWISKPCDRCTDTFSHFKPIPNKELESILPE